MTQDRALPRVSRPEFVVFKPFKVFAIGAPLSSSPPPYNRLVERETTLLIASSRLERSRRDSADQWPPGERIPWRKWWHSASQPRITLFETRLGTVLDSLFLWNRWITFFVVNVSIEIFVKVKLCIDNQLSRKNLPITFYFTTKLYFIRYLFPFVDFCS